MSDGVEETEIVRVEADGDTMVLPILYSQCVLFYEALKEEASPSTEGLIWTGNITDKFDDVGLQRAVYTNVTKSLIAMGCMAQIKRGGGGHPSIYMIFDPPTPQKFLGRHITTSSSSGKGSGQQTRLSMAQMYRDLERRTTRLEQWARAQGAPF